MADPVKVNEGRCIFIDGECTVCPVPCGHRALKRPEPDTSDPRDAIIEELMEALSAASHALRSYQYGNAATELAESIAERCDAALSKAKGVVS